MSAPKFAGPSDYDGDTINDFDDSCPFVPNVQQVRCFFSVSSTVQCSTIWTVTVTEMLANALLVMQMFQLDTLPCATE